MPFVLGAWVGGIFLLQQQSVLPGLWIMATCAAALSVMVYYAFKRHDRAPQRTILLAAVAASVLGFNYAAGRAHWRLSDELAWADQGRDIRITGVVASLPSQHERGTRFEFDVETVHTPGVHVPSRIALSEYGTAATTLAPAQRWSLTVRLKRPHGTLNPGGFDVEMWMLERGLRASGYVRSDAQQHDDWVFKPGPLIDRVRFHLRDALSRQLDGHRFGGVLIALVLGDQRAISANDWVLFNRSGISHLVSISGLHITMIAGLVAWLVSALWRLWPRALALAPAQTAAAVAAMSVAWAYCLLAGWGVPAQRTFFMLTVVALALLVRRSIRLPTILAMAAAAVCLLDPWAVVAPGFWLSFGAVAAIMWTVAGHTRVLRPRWKDKLKAAVHVQLAITLALMPLTVALFAQLSLVSPLANALAIPVVSLVVTPLALLASVLVVLPQPWGHVASALLEVAHGLFEYLANVLQIMVQLPGATVAWATPPAWALVCALLGVAWLLAPRGWPLRRVGVLWLLPVLVWPPPRPGADELWVTALDVGQGTSVVLQTQAHTVLYDTGPSHGPESDAGDRIVVPYLKQRGLHALDLMVISHLDDDHSGGAASVYKEIDVQHTLTSIEPDHDLFQNVTIKKPQRCEAGLEGTLGRVYWRVLHPTPFDYVRWGQQPNRISCVLTVRFGPHQMLLMGDVPAQAELEILKRSDPAQIYPTTLMLVAHHGSRTSSTERWVQATQPKWAIYTVGYRNRYQHPHPWVVHRFEQVGAQAIRTDMSGATTWRLHANGHIEVAQSRKTHAHYWHNQVPSEI